MRTFLGVALVLFSGVLTVLTEQNKRLPPGILETRCCPLEVASGLVEPNPRHNRLWWSIQICVEKRSIRRRLEVGNLVTPLENLILITWEIEDSPRASRTSQRNVPSLASLQMPYTRLFSASF